MADIYINKAEREKQKELDIREAAHRRTINDPDSNSRQQEDGRRALRLVEKERAELNASIQKKRYERKSAALLVEVQAKFENSEGDERVLSEMEQTLVSLKDKDAAGKAKIYLRDRCDVLREQLQAKAERAAAEKRTAEEKQSNLDAVAGDKAAREIRDKINPRLRLPMAMSARIKAREHFLEQAKRARAVAKTEEGFDEESGARKSAIAKKLAEVFESLAKRLEVFQWDLDASPNFEKMQANRNFWLNESCAPENFNFRSPDGRPTQEQALLRHATEQYFRWAGLENFIGELPNVPAPVHVPGPTHDNLDFVFMIEQQKLQRHLFRESEEMQRRAALEKLRISDPKKFKELSEIDTRPLHLTDDGELYRVETATVENPHSAARLYWPWGEVAKPGVDIHWYAPLKSYYKTPEPVALDSNWGSGEKMEWTQDLRGEWVKTPVQLDGGKWIQDAAGHWQCIGNPATGVLEPPGRLTVISGDHKPLPGDPRTLFRYGHWYRPEEVEAASIEAAKRPFVFDAVPRTELPTLAVEPDYTKIRKPETIWTRHEAKMRQQQETQN